MPAERIITLPDDPRLDELCHELAEGGTELDRTGNWPDEQLQRCAEAGVFRWFLPDDWGGLAWSEADIALGYMRLASACLTTTFVITQRSAACRRIAASDNQWAKEQLLHPLAAGDIFATVGISHLTTSRRHLARPVLAARETKDGFLLDGFTPWVTGADHADVLVVGATLEDGRQILSVVPTDLPGVRAATPERLIGLTAGHTGQVFMERVEVPHKWLLAGPVHDVMAGEGGGATGGLQTSALAVGLAAASLEYIEKESIKRSDLSPPLEALRDEFESVRADLLALARGEPGVSRDALRQRANSLVLRAAQAALAAAKGTGYVLGHPAGRWCREALFFLVWSCPQPVVQAQLCELAGIES